MRVRRFARATAMGMSLVLIVAGVAIAATDIDNNDRAIVGTASTSANAAALVCDGAAVSIQLDIIANNGTIPNNQHYPGSGTVTAPTALTVNSTGALVASGSQSKTFNAAQNFNTTAQTLTFNINLSAASDATTGASSGALTFSEGAGGMVQLGSQVELNVDFTNPLVHWNVTCAPAYTFDGFHSPLNGTSAIDAKAGQGIAFKWNLFESLGGPELNDAGKYSVGSVRTTSGCVLNGTNDDAPPADDAGASGIRYDAQGTFVWKTLKSWAGTCRTFSLMYEGATVAEVVVSFPK